MKRIVLFLLLSMMTALSVACGGGGGDGGGAVEEGPGFQDARPLADIASELGELEVRSVCEDGSGGWWAAGYYKGVIDYDSGSAGTEGEEGAFVAKVGADGAVTHFEVHPGVAPLMRSTICPDGSGGCWLAGLFAGELTFGGVDLEAYGSVDLLAAHLAPDFTWDRVTHAGCASGTVRALSTGSDGSGGCWISGYFNGTLNLGGDTSVSNPSSNGAAFFAHLAAAGVWDRALAYPASAGNDSLGMDAFQTGEDDTWCVLLFRGTIDSIPGSGTLIGTGGTNFDLVLLHLNRFGDVQHLYHPAVPVPVPSVPEKSCFLLSDGAGGVLVTGRFTGLATIGSATFVNPTGVPFSMLAFRYLPATGPDFAVSIPNMRPDCVSMESGGDFWFGGVLGGPSAFGSYSYTGAGALVAARLKRLDRSWDFATVSEGHFTSAFDQLRMAGLLPAAGEAVAFGAFNTYTLKLGLTSLPPAGATRWDSFFCRLQLP